ncbi:MAG: hypothetical protein ACXAE3_12600 [Candidatus Kariarchaeaceae archaeon]|jgi:hypothetical protein
MIIVWALLLLTDQVPELQTQPLDITYHLISEGVCATLLLSSAYLLWRKYDNAMNITYAAWGSMFYSVCVNTPYYWNQQNWAMVGIFTVIQILTITLALSTSGVLARSSVLSEHEMIEVIA